MHILLVGAGAIGSWIGANLSRRGHAVVFVGRAAFVGAVRTNGLRVALPGGESWRFEPEVLRACASVSEALSGAAAFDATILCVKTYALDAALIELQPHADRLGQIVTFQNGVGSEERAAEHFGLQRVTSATLTSPIGSVGFGEISLDRLGGGVGVADMAGGGFAGRMVRECATEFMSVLAFDDYRAMKWSKMLLNIVGNATSALFDKDVAQVYADPQLFALEMRMVRECLAVMRALRIRVVNLPGYSARAFALAAGTLPNVLARLVLARRVARGRGGKRPSFYYDVANRTGRSEIGALNGRIAEESRRLGLPAPANRWLTDEMLRRVRADSSAGDSA